MTGRIISLTLRAENQVSTVGHMEFDSLRIRGVGESIFEDKDEIYDAQVTKATGFDAPVFDVQGGALYSGGSQFNGFRAHDRELVITMLPVRRLAPSDIKNRVSRMISMSNMHPLTLQIEYATDDSKAKYTADVYVSNISSPIFVQSREVQLTLKMGDVSFEGPTVSTNATVSANDDKVGFSSMMRSVTPSKSMQIQSRHLYLSESVLSHSNAPFKINGTFWLSIPKETLEDVESIDIVNGRGDGVLLVRSFDTIDKFTKLMGDKAVYDFGIEFNSNTRDVRFLASRGGAASPIKDGPYKMLTQSKWPLGMPVKTALSIQVKSKKLISTSLFSNTISATFAPERYGF